MRSITSAVEELIKEDPVALEALQSGILNLSGYARKIHKEVEKRTTKDVDQASIIVAISRISKTSKTSDKLSNKAIGIMDSGIGGLTVVKEIRKALPNENIIYLGDTARVPYGSRGKETIKDFSQELLNYLLKQEVKYIVVACNTISATCIDELREQSDVDLIGVIKPSVKAVIAATKTKQVGIIGTLATIRTGAYEEEIRKIDPSVKVKSKATPLLVPIVEDGLGDTQIAKAAVAHYLADMNGIDTLHLACTHYPILRDTIQSVVGPSVQTIDSAESTARELRRILIERNLLNQNQKPNLQLNFTDLSEFTLKTAETFMGKDVSINVNQINLTSLN